MLVGHREKTLWAPTTSVGCSRFFIRGIVVLLVFLSGVSDATADEPVFTDVTINAGIVHTHNDPTGVFWTFAGAAAGDFDGDGWTDIFFTMLDGPDVLYRNNQDGTFSNVSVDAGFTDSYRSGGAAWGDIDNDGDMDLYVTTAEETRNYLYINDGAGHFTEQGNVRNAAVDTGVSRKGYGVAFGDYDRDGYLDILTSDWGNMAEDSQSRLLRNLGWTMYSQPPGHFEDVTNSCGLDVYRGNFTLRFTPQFTDIDQDGHTDIVMVSDLTTSQLFWNNGDNTFTDGTEAAAVGTDQAGMGSAIADFDGDGNFDWFVTAIQPFSGPLYEIWTGNRLYRNFGDRQFIDMTDHGGVRISGWGWGTVPIDFDNDGDRDLAVTNGWLIHDVFMNDPTTIWENNGDGTFDYVTTNVGVNDDSQGRGLVQLDYDNDGDLDLLVVNYDDRPVLYRNDSGNSNNWLRIDLQGTRSNRNGIGAIISVVPDLTNPDELLVWEVRSGDSYCSQSEITAHFGLGDLSGTVDKVSIKWPSGIVQELSDVPVNQKIVVVESAKVR